MKDIKEFENKLILGDCLEVMKEMPDKIIDLCLTDPPYKIQFTGKGSLAKKFDYRKKAIEGIGSNPDFQLDIFLDAIRPKMKIMNMYVWMAKGSIPETIDWIRKNDYFWDLLVWGKKNPLPAYNFKYLSDIEYCFFIRERGAHWTKGLRYEDYKKVMLDNLQSYPGHPTPKPMWMMEKLIKISSKEDDIVFDPFVGSGTSCIAAKHLGRRYCGIEILPTYYEIACNRVKQEVRDMFV